MSPIKQRATDGPPPTTRLGRAKRRVSIAYARWGRDAVMFLAVALAAYSVISVQGAATDATRAATDAKTALAQSARERAERTDQLCSILERREDDDIDALAQTYRYLGGLSDREFAEPINKAVLANLPKTIRDAQTPDAPPYCNDPGIGLPEPKTKEPFPEPPPNLPKSEPTEK